MHRAAGQLFASRVLRIACIELLRIFSFRAETAIALHLAVFHQFALIASSRLGAPVLLVCASAPSCPICIPCPINFLPLLFLSFRTVFVRITSIVQRITRAIPFALISSRYIILDESIREETSSNCSLTI